MNSNSDPNNCGGCGIVCSGATPICIGGSCQSSCPVPPNTMCGAACIDTQSDPDHCGACDNECPSRRCVAGMCTPQVGGHFVWIGHSYAASTNSNMNGLITNGAFLVSNNIRIMTYQGSTSASSISNIKAAINAAPGTNATFTDNVPANEVTAQLNDHDVFLIFAQGDTMTNFGLQSLGGAWLNAFDAFLRNGGVIIIPDGPASHDGTFQIFEGAGLLSGNTLTNVTATTELQIIVPTDSIASGPAGQLTPLYDAIDPTVRMDGFIGNADTTVVVEESGVPNAQPVVVHGFLRP